MKRGELENACEAFNSAFLVSLPDQTFWHRSDCPDESDRSGLLDFAVACTRQRNDGLEKIEAAICSAATITGRYRFVHLAEPAELKLRSRLRVWSTGSGSPMSRRVAAMA